jgi:hypothetical protein
MKEFETSLGKMISGNMSLVDQIGSVQLAIQQAIRSVTSSEITSFFVNKQNGALRSRLGALDSDLKLGRISQDSFNSQAGEILKLLEKLGEPLSLKEKEMLKQVKIHVPFFCSHFLLNTVTLFESLWNAYIIPVHKKYGWVHCGFRGNRWVLFVAMIPFWNIWIPLYVQPMVYATNLYYQNNAKAV